MKEVELSSENVEPPPWMPDLERVTHHVYAELDREAWQVSVLLCNEERITELNETYRKASGPTDVLTFSHHHDQDASPAQSSPGTAARPISGDIAVALPVVEANATAYGVNTQEEFLRVFVHALLHLAGFTHDGMDLSSPKAADHPMLGLQERLVSELHKEHAS